MTASERSVYGNHLHAYLVIDMWCGVQYPPPLYCCLCFVFRDLQKFFRGIVIDVVVVVIVVVVLVVVVVLAVIIVVVGFCFFCLLLWFFFLRGVVYFCIKVHVFGCCFCIGGGGEGVGDTSCHISGADFTKVSN